jgi:hypothetical protein
MLKQQVITECDWPAHEGLHGEGDKITTVEFGIDGITYEIDLCDPQATELRDFLADYVANARKKAKPTTAAAAPVAKPPRGQAAKQAREKREYYSKVRGWANEQRTDDGEPRFNVSDRGQIAYEILNAYDMAMAEQQRSDTASNDGQQQNSEQQDTQPDTYQQSSALEPAFIGV